MNKQKWKKNFNTVTFTTLNFSTGLVNSLWEISGLWEDQIDFFYFYFFYSWYSSFLVKIEHSTSFTKKLKNGDLVLTRFTEFLVK